MKILLILLAVVAGIAIAAVLVLRHPAFGRKMSKERKARIEASPNYRDGMFQNEEETPQFTGDKSPMAMLWDFIAHRPQDRVPTEALPAVKTDLKSLPTDKDWLVWFGHSSYLFCLSGKRYLVDPLLKMEFPAAVMMKPFKGTDLYTPDDMPDIDVLIITHAHWDHLDYATLRDLRDRVGHVVCPLGVGEYMEYWKYDKSIISELDWYESLTGGAGLTAGWSNSETVQQRSGQSVTCLPTRHFSNRLLGGRNQTLWASFMVEANGRKVYIGGDGGYDGRFRRIREQFGEIDLALLENGQYNSDWKYIHTTPESLEQVILDLSAKAVFTVHHDKFALAKHPWYEPDSVARSIAERHDIRLLDQPIGTVIYF
ncbi:MAG: MBL fold metallo-hydrolase [Paludibacteraceae bacterium]|nr:MBL fold metallo-hydrolase [Paludibacteraceae bacterium]